MPRNGTKNDAPEDAYQAGLAEVRAYPDADFAAKYPERWSDPDVQVLMLHLLGAGIQPQCLFARLTAPGPVVGRDGWGPVTSIRSDGNGGWVASKPDGTITVRSIDSEVGRAFPQEVHKEEVRRHFLSLNPVGQARYLARLATLGTKPEAVGLSAPAEV